MMWCEGISEGAHVGSTTHQGALGVCGTPAQRKPERPVFQPRDRDEVFWNMALLSIEQTGSLLQSIWVQGLHRHGDTMSATVVLCKQQNNSKQRDDF